MKTDRTLLVLEVVALVIALLVAISVGAQAPSYKFKNPTLVSGTAGQVNATYRFPNVKTSSGSNIDALVKITNKVGNITLQNIDRTADGYSEAFQPEYTVGASSNAYMDFQITFVQNGTSTAAPQPQVELSALDIDGFDTLGYKLKEFNRVDLGGGICTFNLMGSQLTIYQAGTAFEGDNFTGVLFGALVDTMAKEVMFSVTNVNVTSFTYRIGSNNLLPAQMTRYASLYFKKFNYPTGVILAARSLASFTGTSTNNKTNLTWTLTDGNDAANVVLEKSATGNSFLSVAEFTTNSENNSQKDFNYTDTKDFNDVTYYRLKIVSRQGKVEYSNVLRFAAEKNTADQFAVYPSLVQSNTTISYTAKEKQSGVILVADLSGRIVKQQNVLLEEGTNSIQVSGFDQYRKGNYIVSVATANQKSARQIVVQ